MESLARKIGAALAILNPTGKPVRPFVKRSIPANDNDPLPDSTKQTLAAYLKMNRETAGDFYQPAAAKNWWIP